MNSYRESVRRTLMKFALIPVLLLVLLAVGLVVGSWEYHVVQQSDVSRIVAREVLDGIFSDYAMRAREAAERVGAATVPVLRRNGSERASLYAYLYHEVNIAHDGTQFFLLDSNGALILGSKNGLPEMRIPLQPSWGVLCRMRERPDTVCAEFVVRTDGRQDLIIGQSVGEETEGYLFFVIPSEYLVRSITSPHLGFALTDAFGNACIMTGGEWEDGRQGKIVPAFSSAVRGVAAARGEQYFVTSEPLAVPGGWRLWSVMPVSNLFSHYLLGLVILLCVLAVLVPLLLLSVRRETRARIRMVEQEEARVTAVSEMRRLESQFNPHFLFNTLENVRFMVKLDPAAAQHMLMELASLLRYSIKGEARCVPLSEDMTYTHSYMEIQQYRFGKRLRYEEELAPDVLDCMVPRLFLQPLLENAVRYGASEDGTIRIALRAEMAGHDTVEVIVRDYGMGMEKEKLAHVRGLLQAGKGKAEGICTHTGIYNVHRRLELMYGMGFGLTVWCPPDGGTAVTLHLPAERRGQRAEAGHSRG